MLVYTFYYRASQFATAIALKVIKYKAGEQFTFHDDAKSHRTQKDNNCVNFWCRKSLGKLNHVPASNKTDSFSILDLFYVKIKFLNERNCSEKRYLIIWYLISDIDAITYFKPSDFTNRQILTLGCGHTRDLTLVKGFNRGKKDVKKLFYSKTHYLT